MRLNLPRVSFLAIAVSTTTVTTNISIIIVVVGVKARRGEARERSYALHERHGKVPIK
jgi:hypothetical protein